MTDERTEVDVRYNGTALDVEVADGGILDEGKQTAPLVGDIRVIICNGVSRAVEDALHRIGFRTNHQVGIRFVSFA